MPALQMPITLCGGKREAASLEVGMKSQAAPLGATACGESASMVRPFTMDITA